MGVSAYAREVERALKRARALISPQTRLIWVGVHPWGGEGKTHYHDGLNGAQGDWRSDITLRDYSAASLRVAAQLGVEHLDVWSVGDTLRDLTYDGSHFSVPVEQQLARMALHVACSDGAPPPSAIESI